MIDALTFANKMTLLLGRFGREMSEVVQAEYYRHLKDRMTSEEFIQAAERVFFEDEFFPTPKQLLEKVKPDARSQAVMDWDELWEAIARNRPENLSEIGRKALRSVGGRSVVGYTNLDKIPWVKKDFLEAYEIYAKHEAIVHQPVFSGRQQQQLSASANGFSVELREVEELDAN